jgi:transposase
VDDRRVLNGFFWVLRSGAPWRDLPECYGPYTTCYNRFVRWRCAGVWDRILAAISHREDAEVQMIDSTIVRAHQHASCIPNSAEGAIGCSRGGMSAKIHAVVDAKGLPFNRIKHCRRISTRYETHAANFLAFVKLAAIRLWLRAYVSTA